MNLMSDISIYGYLFQYLNTKSQAVLNLNKDSLFFFFFFFYLSQKVTRPNGVLSFVVQWERTRQIYHAG